MSNLGDQWSVWSEIHSIPDQKKRLASAQKAECTPLEVNKEDGSGVFSGVHGQYATTLSSCTCADFSRRDLPCKHMYRLAVELSLIDEEVVSDISKVKCKTPKGFNLSQAVDLIELLPENTQKTFKELLLEFAHHGKERIGLPENENLHILAHNEMVMLFEDFAVEMADMGQKNLMGRLKEAGITGLKRNTDKVEWCLTNAAERLPEICRGWIAVSLHPNFVATKRKTYTYLHRKFDTDSYLDPESNERVAYPAGAKMEGRLHIALSENCSSEYCLCYIFPDDEVTALLNKNGVNPCNEINEKMKAQGK